MASYNRIILIGNLTRDPQLTYTSSNTAICKFGIATNEKWRDKDGNMKEDVCFVDCVVFGKQGETFNQYMAKGRMVMVEGRLKLDQWTSPEGDKRSKHEVVVDRFVFLGQPGGRNDGGRVETGGGRFEGGGGRYEGGGGREYDNAAPARVGAPSAPRIVNDEPRPPSDDDIPF